MSTQILHLDGRRELAETQVLIANAERQDITWEISVLEDGAMLIALHGTQDLFNIQPLSSKAVAVVRRK